MKKSEKAAKERLRNIEGVVDANHVIRVTKKGAGMEYNQGQAVKQAPGSGLRDIVGFLKPKKK